METNRFRSGPVKLPSIDEIQESDLNPVIHEHLRWMLLSAFGATDEREPELPKGLSVPRLDLVIGLRWACGVFIDVVENSDMSRERKLKFLGVGIRGFLDA